MSTLEYALWEQLKLRPDLTDGIKREFRFHPGRQWRFDLCWPKDLLALEVQGGIWVGGRHSRGMGLLKDYEKFSAAAALGWRLILVTGREINNGEAVDRIEQGLAWKA